MTATVPAAAPPDPSLFINRELSWLDFNERVLEEARDPSTPLLDRVRFLAIRASSFARPYVGTRSSVSHGPPRTLQCHARAVPLKKSAPRSG